MKTLLIKYKYKDGGLVLRCGPHAGLPISDNELYVKLLNLGYQFDELPALKQTLLELAEQDLLERKKKGH